jgi:hypothetical protein
MPEIINYIQQNAVYWLTLCKECMPQLMFHDPINNNNNNNNNNNCIITNFTLRIIYEVTNQLPCLSLFHPVAVPCGTEKKRHAMHYKLVQFKIQKELSVCSL